MLVRKFDLFTFNIRDVSYFILILVCLFFFCTACRTIQEILNRDLKDGECVYRLINPFELVTIRALLPLIRSYASLEHVSRFVSDDICSVLLCTNCFAKDTSIGYPIKRRFKNDNRIT